MKIEYKIKLHNYYIDTKNSKNRLKKKLRFGRFFLRFYLFSGASIPNIGIASVISMKVSTSYVNPSISEKNS